MIPFINEAATVTGYIVWACAATVFGIALIGVLVDRVPHKVINEEMDL